MCKKKSKISIDSRTGRFSSYNMNKLNKYYFMYFLQHPSFENTVNVSCKTICPFMNALKLNVIIDECNNKIFIGAADASERIYNSFHVACLFHLFQGPFVTNNICRNHNKISDNVPSQMH